MAKNLLNFFKRKKVDKAQLSPTVPTNNPSPGLQVANLGKRKASMSPSKNVSRKVKRTKKKSKSYSFDQVEKKLGVVQT